MRVRLFDVSGRSFVLWGSLVLGCSTSAPSDGNPLAEGERGGAGGASSASGGASGDGRTGAGGTTASGGRESGGTTGATGGKDSVGSNTSLGGSSGRGGAGGTNAATGGKRNAGGASTAGNAGAKDGGIVGASGGRAGGGPSDARGGAGGQGTGPRLDGGPTSPTDGSSGSSGGYPLGNPAVPSAGCGKALSTFKSGSATYKMTSAAINREYIVNIPANYDTNKPYRLVFGMHCMGSSATACANSDQYYRLKPLDTGNTTIFVAPQGYTDQSPWRGGDNKDHTFFDDMVKLLESELCIDTSRVFSVGFSFGAMFTNSLAQTHQDVLRGVVVYATADYNIYFPTNTGKPLAYFGVHGTGDGTCPFKSGKASKDRFVKNNGCTVPASVPEATSSKHVCYDYQCPSNYPVKWCTHNGGHTDIPTDPSDSKSWDIDLTWKFITQF